MYCLSRKSVEQTADFLRSNGVSALPYHAGLPDEERHRNQAAFQLDEVDVIVATVAFGMGIDKSNVRFVIHRDMPKDIESWYQEIGRAGRDGLESDCFLFYSWADVKMHERFLDDIDDPDVWKQKRQRTVDLFQLLESRHCRHRSILRYFDEEMGPCDTSCDVCTGETTAAIAAAGMAALGPVRGAKKSKAKAAPADMSEADEVMFDRLRARRKELADRQKVPAYIVFSDKVLVEMAVRRPATDAELLDVSGVGPAKLERYGADFLDVLTTG